jgi:hypothetical protein
MTHKGLVSADAVEKLDRLGHGGIPRRGMHAAVFPFTVRNDFKIVDRLRMSLKKLRERRVKKQADAQFRV